MKYSFESADRTGLIFGQKDRENNNFASLDLHPIILPSIILPPTADDFRSQRDVQLRLTGKRKSFCPPIILSSNFDVGREDKIMKCSLESADRLGLIFRESRFASYYSPSNHRRFPKPKRCTATADVYAKIILSSHYSVFKF